MQDLLVLPPRTFFKPASFKGGSQNSDYRGSHDNNFFNAFNDGFQNGQKSLFINDDEKSFDNFENTRRHSPGEWNESFNWEKNRTVENPYENPRLLRRISPTQADKIQDIQEIQQVAERYEAFGARPFVRSEVVSPMDQELLSSNRKGSYKDSKKLFVFLWVLIFLFIALGGISIGLGLHYGLSENRTSPNQLTLDFTVVNVTFDANLTNKSSSSYSTWKARICDACANFLKKQNSKDSLVQSCSDISFKPGSIKVSLNLVVSPDLSKSEAIRRLNESFPDRFLPGFECRFESAGTRSEGPTSSPQVFPTTTIVPALEGTTSINHATKIHGDSPALPYTTSHATSTLTIATSTTTTRTAETTATTNPTTITSDDSPHDSTEINETTNVINISKNVT